MYQQPRTQLDCPDPDPQPFGGGVPVRVSAVTRGTDTDTLREHRLYPGGVAFAALRGRVRGELHHDRLRIRRRRATALAVQIRLHGTPVRGLIDLISTRALADLLVGPHVPADAVLFIDRDG